MDGVWLMLANILSIHLFELPTLLCALSSSSEAEVIFFFVVAVAEL